MNEAMFRVERFHLCSKQEHVLHDLSDKWNSIVLHGGKGIHAGGDEPLHGVKQREDQKYYGVAVKEECQFAGDRMKRVALGIATNAEDIGNLDHNAEPEQI